MYHIRTNSTSFRCILPDNTTIPRLPDRVKAISDGALILKQTKKAENMAVCTGINKARSLHSKYDPCSSRDNLIT